MLKILFLGRKGEDTMNVGVFSEDKSNFMVYFFLLSIVSIMAYLVFHNKQKVGWLDYWLAGWFLFGLFTSNC